MAIGNTLGQMLGCDPLTYTIFFRVHATKRMFDRKISQDEVREDNDKEDICSITRRLDEIFRSWAEKEKIDTAGKI